MSDHRARPRQPRGPQSVGQYPQFCWVRGRGCLPARSSPPSAINLSKMHAMVGRVYEGTDRAVQPSRTERVVTENCGERPSNGRSPQSTTDGYVCQTTTCGYATTRRCGPGSADGC